MSETTSDQIFNEPVDSLAPREGLPRQYRMRADRHYVDQLASSSGQPVRIIPLNEIETATVDAVALQPLIESIRRHGVVQPLLVRRENGRYRVISGRKRLLAAITLQLPAVPCLVHDVSDAEAEALAAADNMRVGTTDSPEHHEIGELTHVLAAHMAGIRHCAELCDGHSVLRGAAVDLLRAHAWRASRLLDAFNLIRHSPAAAPRERALAAIMGELVDGFATESRASGVTIQAEMRDNVSSAGFNDSQIIAGVSGALLAVIPLVEGAVRPLIVVRTSSTSGTDLTIEIIQSSAPVPQRIADHFFDGDASRPGSAAAAVGALAAKALAGAHGGKAIFERLPHGSRLVIFLTRPS